MHVEIAANHCVLVVLQRAQSTDDGMEHGQDIGVVVDAFNRLLALLADLAQFAVVSLALHAGGGHVLPRLARKVAGKRAGDLALDFGQDSGILQGVVQIGIGGLHLFSPVCVAIGELCPNEYYCQSLKHIHAQVFSRWKP